MKRLLYFILTLTLCLISCICLGQNLLLDSITALDPIVVESSGMIYLQDKLITHNDSGGEAALYEVDTLSGNVIRKVVISNIPNTDWEDICYDDTHIYIGDFGNNFGTRQDLKVYKVLIADFQTKDTLVAESIAFSYADQTTFNSNQFQTNFDVEGLISWGDSLYIFSKNWGNSKTNIYPLSKTPGTYVISKTDSIDTQGLITGANFDAQSGELWICGYTFSEAFVIQIKQWTGSVFSSGQILKFPLGIRSSFQVEAITKGPGNDYYVSAEGNASIPAVLYKLSFEEANGNFSYESLNFKVFPNPAKDKVIVESPYPVELSLFTMEGKKLVQSSSHEIDISHFSTGVYVLKIFNPQKNLVDIRKILIEK